MSTTEKTRDSGQTPSMLASLLVFGVMIGLILLSVFLFPEEVDAGSLQISMTLATLFAVTELTGMIQRVIAPVTNWVQRVSALIAATSLTSIGLSLVAADPYVSIVLAARMYRDTYMKHQIEPVVLSTVIADSGSMISYIIPWNVHGAFVIGALGVGMAYAPYAFLSYFSPLVTIILAFVYFNKMILPADEDAETVYGTEPKDVDLPALQLFA